MSILLVDDEYISNFINRKLIENINPAIQVTEINDPEEAFSKLSALAPDLIFLDVNMPVMNGWDFLNKMAAENLHYKVVIVTSSVNPIDNNMARQYPNVVGFIEKPATLANIRPYIAQLGDTVA
jgi:CheY-like chemotaxis protein